MIDEPDHDSDLEATDDVAGIGVGMGGSCPECRAPVDLGQEFCLECGSAIRFTGRQRRSQRTGDPRPRSAAPAAPIPGRSFPWAPFAIILILVIGGLGFALMDGDSASSSKDTKRDTTEPALPSITNSTPDDTTRTETVETCPDGGGFAGTEPAVEDGSSGLADSATGSEAEIPEIDGAGLGDDANAADQSIPPTGSEEDAGDGGTVTVDREGFVCGSGTDDGSGSETPSEDPTASTPADTTDTSNTTGTPGAPGSSGTDTTTANGSWPSGTNGWTVIINGNAGSQVRANQVSSDAQAKQLEAGVLKSDDYVSLCPGNWVVFSGVFTSEKLATAHQAKARAAGFPSYVREVRTSGTPASC